jgi:hypothetical protein
MSRTAPLPHYRKRRPTTQQKENIMNKSTATPATKPARMARFLYWIADRLPCRIIDGDDGPYLERYYLATLFGWQFYLHRFVADDPDRGLHDHPWRLAFSLILSGFYYEETRAGTRLVRWFNWLTGDSFHRVVLPFHAKQITPTAKEYAGPFIPCWTLFCHGPTVKDWGFIREYILNGEAVNNGWRGGLPFRYVSYPYTREGKQDKWWKLARKGRNAPGRVPL